eukprot:639206-Amphidinium_carterae.1
MASGSKTPSKRALLPAARVPGEATEREGRSYDRCHGGAGSERPLQAMESLQNQRTNVNTKVYVRLGKCYVCDVRISLDECYIIEPSLHGGVRGVTFRKYFENAKSEWKAGRLTM